MWGPPFEKVVVASHGSAKPGMMTMLAVPGQLKVVDVLAVARLSH